MGELKFVIKCFLFTSLLVAIMQVKVGGVTMEVHTFNWLRYSKASQYVQSVAAGGAMAARNLLLSTKEAFSSTVDGFEEGAHEKAVR